MGLYYSLPVIYNYYSTGVICPWEEINSMPRWSLSNSNDCGDSVLCNIPSGIHIWFCIEGIYIQNVYHGKEHPFDLPPKLVTVWPGLKLNVLLLCTYRSAWFRMYYKLVKSTVPINRINKNHILAIGVKIYLKLCFHFFGVVVLEV